MWIERGGFVKTSKNERWMCVCVRERERMRE